MRYNSILLFVFILIYTFTFKFSFSQSLNNLKFKHFSIKEGLSQITCMSILQDEKGFLWIATQDGLNRFDGINFKYFKHNNKNNSLSDNYIWSMIMDSKGNLWLGTYNGGLNKFERDTESFTSFQFNENDTNSISSNRVYSILEDSRGKIWVGTLEGLNLFNPDTGKFRRFKNNPNDINSLSHNRVMSIVEDQKGNIIVGTYLGLNILSKEDLNNGIYNFAHIVHDDDKPNSLSHNRIWKIYIDKSNNLWAGTRIGLNLLKNNEDIKNNNFIRFKNDKDAPNSISHNLIWSIQEDKSGNLWIGTGNGLNLFNPEKIETPDAAFSSIVHLDKNPNSLSNNRIMSLFEDKKGNLWIGTRRGLNLLDLKLLSNPQKSFLHFYHDDENPNSLSHNTIRSIHEDRKGNLWIGTHVGLNLLHHSKKKLPSSGFTRFLNDDKNQQSLSHNRVMSIFEDSEDNLWFGTLQGLNKLKNANLIDKNVLSNKEKRELPNATFERFFHTDKENNTFNNNVVWSMIQDKQGNLWLGTEGGLKLLPSKKSSSNKPYYENSFVQFNDLFKDAKELTNTVVRKLFIDSSEKMWIGTDNKGLNLYDQSSGSFKGYMYNPEDIKSISHNKVSHISADKDGMWITSYGGGLNYFNTITEEFEHYNQAEDILPTDGCSCVLSDDNGFKWASTINGFLRFNPETKQYFRYDERDGLQGLGFNVGVCYKAKDGTMYFGGINGLNSFHPDSIQQSNFQPQLQLTNFQIFNKDVSVKTNDSTKYEQVFTMDKNIAFADKIVLPHNAYVLSFEYAAMDFNIAERNNYRYMLEGFDENWNLVGNQRRATYTNIKHGEYTLKIQGTNNDGVWSKHEISLPIIITPPWYLTNLAISIWVFFAIGVPIFFYKWRVKSLKKQKLLLKQQVADRTQKISQQNKEISMYAEELLITNERLNELNNFKESLTGMIVHDLKNTLNTIIGLSSDAPSQEKQNTIRQAGFQMLNMVSNILDVYKFENAEIQLKNETYTITEITKAALLQVQYLFEENRINLISKIEKEHVVKVDFDLLVRVIVNLLTNAIKFTPFNGDITLISKHLSEDKIEFSVVDTGLGIDHDKLDTVFEKFGQVKAKNSGLTRSTGLGLTFCKMVIEAHDCEIKVSSEPEIGTTFYFTMPTGNKDELLVDFEEEHELNQEKNNTQLSLSESDKTILKAILLDLKNTEIYYNSDLEKILGKIDYSLSDGLQLWHEAMQQAMFHVSEPLYKELIDIIESENGTK